MTSPRDASPTGTSKFSASESSKRVLVIFGTRPEAIKLGPLLSELRNLEPQIRTSVCVTGQHRELLNQVLGIFNIEPDRDLAIMQPQQTLHALTSRLIAAIEPVLAEFRPSLVVVQGDTTTTFCAALSSFYSRIPVAHVEAGLRTGDLLAPFPEEMNRVATARLSTLHFAPTERAAANLLREGVPAEFIEVTGNTGIDAVLEVCRRLEQSPHQFSGGCDLPLDPDRKLIVMTAHRRESLGEDLDNVCRALALIAERSDVQIAWPVHPNPKLQPVVDRFLSGRSNVLLLAPLPYVHFVDLLRRATLILTDSGGIQEEAPSLGKPVLVLRDTTERPEAVEAGTVRLVGSDFEAIVRHCENLLDDPDERERMSRIHNPYGDGRASRRIAQRIRSFLIDQHVG